MAAEFGHLIQIELLNDLQSEQIATKDSYFCIQIGRVVVIHAVVPGVAQILKHRVRFVDGYAAHRVINRRDSQSCDEGSAEDREECTHYYPFAFDEDSQVLAQN